MYDCVVCLVKVEEVKLERETRVCFVMLNYALSYERTLEALIDPVIMYEEAWASHNHNDVVLFSTLAGLGR